MEQQGHLYPVEEESLCAWIHMRERLGCPIKHLHVHAVANKMRENRGVHGGPLLFRWLGTFYRRHPDVKSKVGQRQHQNSRVLPGRRPLPSSALAANDRLRGPLPSSAPAANVGGNNNDRPRRPLPSSPPAANAGGNNNRRSRRLPTSAPAANLDSNNNNTNNGRLLPAPAPGPANVIDNDVLAFDLDDAAAWVEADTNRRVYLYLLTTLGTSQAKEARGTMQATTTEGGTTQGGEGGMAEGGPLAQIDEHAYNNMLLGLGISFQSFF